MKKSIIILSSILAGMLILSACKKNADTPLSTDTTLGNILSSEANVIIYPSYTAVVNDMTSLINGIAQFQSSPTQPNLSNCRQLWTKATEDYEQTDAFLLGPTVNSGTDGIVNAFPVDTFGVDTVVSGNSVLTQDYISNLATSMIGFHCMEFELYGGNGTKTAPQFTQRQISYIAALAVNIQSQIQPVDSAWIPSISGDYNYQFSYAGSGGTVYVDQRAAYSDLIMGIANICETDNIYKMNNPLSNHNAGLEESPFANNSIDDIKNNIIGVRNIYMGIYNGQQGYGISNLVLQYNPSLDNQIRNDITNALNALDAITVPLNQAIIQQPGAVRNAMEACDELDDDLKNDLQLYVDKYVN